MHGPQGVLETTMFSSRKHPPRTLELMNVAQTLHPWRVNEVFLSDLCSTMLRRLWHRKGDVFVNGIGKERQSLIALARLLRGFRRHERRHGSSFSHISDEAYAPFIGGTVAVENM